MNSERLKVGVTGGIGSGKSTICNIFLLLGVPVYEADTRAKFLMEHDGHLKTKIVETFGADVYLPGQRLNRAYLSATLFKDKAKVQLINDLVHPVVQRDYVRWIKENRGHSYTVKEAALLFESGSYQQLDKIITVTAPRDIRIQRILLRDANRTKQQVEEIMQSQWPENEKIEKSHFVINNDNSRLIIPQVLKIHEILAG